MCVFFQPGLQYVAKQHYLQNCSPLHPPPMTISSFNTLCSKSLALLVAAMYCFYWLRLFVSSRFALLSLHGFCGEKFRGEARHFAPNHSTHPLTLRHFCTQEQCPCEDNSSIVVAISLSIHQIKPCQPPPQNHQPETSPPSTSSTVSPRH